MLLRILVCWHWPREPSSETMSLNYDHIRAYCSSPRWNISMHNNGRMILTGGNIRTRRKPCPSATTSTAPGVNPCLHGERSATNRLNHGTAKCSVTSSVKQTPALSLSITLYHPPLFVPVTLVSPSFQTFFLNSLRRVAYIYETFGSGCFSKCSIRSCQFPS
jgi:hypothetical protein